MDLHKDFREFLELFNDHHIEYMVVGGYALAFHGAPRYTGDIDVWVKPDVDNARKVIQALDDFGFSFSNLTPDDFSQPSQVIQLGLPPVRIDLLTSISGVLWEEAIPAKQMLMIADISIPFIGKESLLANKKASGRAKDLADVEALVSLPPPHTRPSSP